MGQKLTVVLSGATGNQGGAVAKRPLVRGHKVARSRAVRLRKGEGARKRGHHARPRRSKSAALTKAFEGATSLFSMRTPFGGGTQAETRQASTPRTRPRPAGVDLHFTSVGSANRRTGVPHFDSKHEVEKHIARIGVRATVLAPGHTKYKT